MTASVADRHLSGPPDGPATVTDIGAEARTTSRGQRCVVLILSRRDVVDLLDLDQLIEALSTAMVDLSAGRASMPPRGAARVESHDAMLAAMPAFLPSAGALTTKLVSLFPHNRDRPTHQAVICCFDPATGTPLALMDGTYITAIRTAAGSLLAAQHLARPGSRDISIIGTGAQARAHALAFAGWHGLELVRVSGRDPRGVEALVAELTAEGLRAEATGLEEAVGAADIVCATTHADVPVVRREWVRAGTHVSSVGYNSAGEGEVDAALVREAMVVVESRAAALAPPPAGAVELRATADGAPRCVEIGEVIAGTSTGRSGDDAITLYKSVGVAVQDAAAASLVLAAADRQGRGVRVELV